MNLKRNLIIYSGLLLSMANPLFAANLSAVPGEFVVTLKRSLKELSTQSVARSMSAQGLRVKKTINSHAGVYLVKRHNSELNTASTLELLKADPTVAYVEPNFIYRISGGSRAPSNPGTNPEDSLPTVFPNDSKFSSLWNMRNDGQADSSGKRGQMTADIHAVNAWAIAKGSRNVVVGIIDTGIDYRHPDLVNNLWSMPGRSDVHGYNAIKDNLDPMDDNDHGTHVAGTIGAQGGNGQGVVGVNWSVSIMALKFLDADGSGTLADAIASIDWAREHGAQVLNNSWGGGDFSQALMDAIIRAQKAGILFIAAAGNSEGGHNNDSSPSYPASYKVDNIVSVASTNNLDKLSSFSHYGAKSVHIAAPGENILSTFPNGKYASISGTSMACPHVAGAVALLLSKEPSLSYLQVKDRVLSGVDMLSQLKNKVSSSGRLNIYKMLTGTTSR